MIRPILGKCWSGVAIAIIFAAVLITLARLVLPYADRYHSEIIFLLSDALEQTVEVGRIEAGWHGFGPRLQLYDVRLLDETGQTLVQFNETSVGLDIFSSVLNAELRLGSLALIGVEISVTKDSEGMFSVEGFGGQQQGLVAEQDNDFLTDWILRQSHLALESSTIHWRKTGKNARQLQFVDVNLELRNDGDRHQFTGSASLPEKFGSQLSFAFDIAGDPTQPRGWSGDAYLNGSGLMLGPLLDDTQLAGISVEAGVGEIRVWSQWKDAHIQRIEGDVSAFGFRLAALPSSKVVNSDKAVDADKAVDTDKASLEIDALSGNFVWQRDVGGWHLAGDRIVLSRGDVLWPFSRFNVVQSGVGPDRLIQANIGYLRLNEMIDVLRLSRLLADDVRTILEGIQPGGEVYDLMIEHQVAQEKTLLSGRFEDLSMTTWRKIPGIVGADGRFALENADGYLGFDTSEAVLDATSLFRTPLKIDEMRGDVSWWRIDQGWQIESQKLALQNEDLKLHLGAQITIQNGRAENMDLQVRFKSDSVVNTSFYLPAKIMPKGMVKWLDRGILEGRVTYGQAIFHGSPSKFPFDNDEGVFEVRFDVEDALLDYALEWPVLEDVDAEVVFTGRSMMIDAVDGRIFGSKIKNTHVEIPDLAQKPPLLKIRGHVDGPVTDVFHFLRNSPLAKKYGAFLDIVKGGGTSHLDLDLAIPLDKSRADVMGTLAFEDGELNLSVGDVRLSQLRGHLGFTEEGLSGEGLTGKLFDMDAVFNVATLNEDGRHVTQVKALGPSVDAAFINDYLKLPLLEHLEGNTAWRGSLEVPTAAPGESTRATLRIYSDLEGMAVNLPAPMTKSAAMARALEVEVRFPQRPEMPLRLVYGDQLDALFALDSDNNLLRAGLHFGAGVAVLPGHDGIMMTGQLPSVSYTDWDRVMADSDEVTAPGNDTINSVALYAQDLEVYGQHFTDINIQAARTNNAWRGSVAGKDITGSIQIPLVDGVPVLMDLEYLHLKSSTDSEDEGDINPVDFPPANISSQQFVYNEVDYGSMELVATKRSSGLHLDRLVLSDPKLNLVARGNWLRVNDAHYSSFDINATTDNLGKTLKKLGYRAAIKNGKGTVNIVARWPGLPTSFSLADMEGTLAMRFKNGRLSDVDPGAGRLFGLISLQVLPRRLLLDFSDIFKKGFSFDKINADFNIADGYAKTTNLVMDGPAARIDMTGDIGLMDQSYDQLVKVTPHVTSSIPLAGAVFAGPGIGAALLLAQKLFEPKIDKMTQIRYSLTGTWDDPVIKEMH